jgi:hypothetical protein
MIAAESLRFGHHLLEFEVHPALAAGGSGRRPPPRAVSTQLSEFHFEAFTLQPKKKN